MRRVKWWDVCVRSEVVGCVCEESEVVGCV